MAGPLCPPRKPGHPPPGPGKGWRCQHDSCDAIRDRTPPSALADTLQWLAANIGHLRRHPAAADAFRELHTATHQLERLVDRPADNRHFIGICDCGKALYAPWDWTVIQCKERTCGAVWNLADGQDILLRHLDDKLVTVSESLRLAGHLDPERSQDAVRKLIEKWVSHSRLLAHGEVQREPTEAELRRDPDLSLVSVPTYRFGEIRTLLDETPRRERKTAA
jgi:hypothetical protein